jgi:hypothetical protein
MIQALRDDRLFFILLIFYSLSYTQTVQFKPDTAAARHLWHISDSATLYIGASFYYMHPQDSIIVWLDTSDADTTGTLYFMVPGFKDSALALFTNRQQSARVNITKTLNNWGITIPVGTEIFFRYKSIPMKSPRYTGQNRQNTDPRNQIAYPGANFVSRDFGYAPGIYGHRFAAAGRLDPLVNSLNDTIVFGFEDGVTIINPAKDSLIVADWDFNDVIFRTTGLDLNIEAIPDSLLIICKDTVQAGDSVVCKPEVWADSGGTKVRCPKFDSLVTWKFSGRSLLGDTLVPAAAVKGRMIFLPRTAFEKFTFRASLFNPYSGDTIRALKTVLVNPGPARYLSIELRSDSTSPNFSLHSIVQIEKVQISTNATACSLYAVARDRFGNFAGFLSSAKWDTSSHSTLANIKANVLQVRPGRIAKGEAVVTKVTGSGNELVFAQSVVSADTLRDTVIMNVVAADYDSITVCALLTTGLAPIDRCIMSMDQCTTFASGGRRVDTHSWERVETEWRVSPWMPAPIALIDTIHFCPNDTGTGNITVSYQGGRFKQTIPLQVTSGAPAVIQCFTQTATPFPSDTIAYAGIPMTIYARIFDKHGFRLTIPSDQITWEVIEHSIIAEAADSSGRLNASVGSSVVYYPRKARRSVTVKVSYDGLFDTLALSIQPGNPYSISIESSPDWQLSPYSPNPIDTIAIPDDRTSATVWALVRDSLGNFVEFLRSAQWKASDTIITVQAGAQIGEGNIVKNFSVRQGICIIYASQSSGTLLNDTAFVRLLPYHYTALRIVINDNFPLDSLLMTTNDDTTLKAQGLRSDTATWCDVSARWTISDSLVASPPTNSPIFQFSPAKTDTGAIMASLVGGETLRDTVITIFTRGDPVRAEYTILTPDEKRIAGDTIRALIKIFNKDGLLPGDFCYGKGSSHLPAIYQDSLGYGGRQFEPKVFSQEAAGNIAVAPSVGEGIAQCFTDGIDSIGIILYYAPFSKDSLHRLVVKLGAIAADCAPFHLNPGKLASLKVSHAKRGGGDTLVLRSPNERALVYAVGHDRFGNITGEESCTWATSGSLHPITMTQAASRIFYGADSVKIIRDEEGPIIATTVTDTSIVDSLWTLVLGPQAEALSAITKDDNGNGLLDRIVVRFSKPVFLRENDVVRLFSAVYQGSALEIGGVTVSGDSLSADVRLNENPDAPLQTDWTPILTLRNTGFALGGAVDSFSITAADGAGPVIVSVVKELKDEDRHNDLVTVVFSEPVTDKDGNTLSFLLSPNGLFVPWLSSKTDSFDRVVMFDGINELVAPTTPTSVSFRMSNGRELLPAHYVNFRIDSDASSLFDRAGNRPSALNRKVKVVVTGEPGGNLTIGPNPSTPTSLREAPGIFRLQYNPEAIKWVATDNAGFAIKFQIVLPEGTQREIGGRLNIYDVVGNNVIGDPTIQYKLKNIVKGGHIINNENYSNILPSWPANGTVYDYFVYWNGYSKDKRKVAPGIYKAILTLQVQTDGRKETKTLTGLIGVKR